MFVVALLVALQLLSLLHFYGVPLSIFLKRSQESQKYAVKEKWKQDLKLASLVKKIPIFSSLH